MKKLAAYLDALASVEPVLRRGAAGNPAISGVTADSRQVRPGSIYVAVPGVRVDGRDFIPAAIEAGSAVIFHRGELAECAPGIAYCRTENPRRALALLLREFYGCPNRSLRLAGVTGTNGKTTTATLIHQLLNGNGVPAALLSTIDYRTPKRILPSHQTTPDPAVFYEFLAAAVADGSEAAAMELSSHALDQHRTDGAAFQAAVFTNLTGDHLDYHGTVEHYFAAKKRLFTELLAPGAAAIVNTDDPAGRELAAELPGQVISFGRNETARARLTSYALFRNRSEFTLCYRDEEFSLITRLPGLHNLYNLLGALLAAEALGLAWRDCLAAVPELRGAPGRLEFIASPEGVDCCVDYAHTDDALKQVLEALRPLAAGRLIAVFGCGGDRDRSKRPRMGKVAAAKADLIILTSDNPRGEAPEAIIRDIEAGLPPGAAYEVEPDRAAAIRLARKLAKPGDLVLIAGKGHENYQEIDGVLAHFDDREEVRKR